MEPIESSHLFKVSCAGCGGVSLAVKEWADRAMCGLCRGGGVVLPRGSAYTVPVGYAGMARPAMTLAPVDVVVPEHVGSWGSRVECPVGVSRGVLSLAVDGISAGWQVRMRYGRGAGKHSIALAFFGHERGPNEARAVYTRSVRDGASWVCGTVWMFGPELAPFGLAVVSEFREWLEAGGMVDVGWYAGVRARSAERALDAKVVPCKSGCIEIAPHTHRASGRVVASKAKTGAKKESGG